MPRLSFSSLRVRLILLVMIAVIPALGLIIYSNLDQRRHAAEEVKMNALRFTRMAGGNVERFIEGTHQMLNTLTYMYIVRNRDTTACNQRFAALLKQNPHYNNIGATDAAGNIFASAVPYKRPVNFADRAWFRRAVETRNFAVGEFQVGRITGKHTLVFAYPVLDQKGSLLGTVYAATDLTWLNQAVKDTSLPAGSSVTVLDRRGTIITRYPDPEKWTGKTLPEANVIKMILERKEGVTEAAGIDGVARIYAFTPLRGIAEKGIYFGVGLSKASAFAEINRDLVRNLAWLGLVALSALTAAWVGGNFFILQKVRVLLEATQRLRNGDLRARTELPHQNGEISQLACTFDEMAEALEQRAVMAQQAEEALQKAHQLLETIFEHTHLMVAYLDPQFNFVRVNRAYALADEREPSYFPGKNHFDLYPHKENEAIFRHVLETGEPHFSFAKPFEFTEHPERGVSYWDWSLVPIKYFNGRLEGLILTLQNVTDRVRAEKALRESENAYRTLAENLPAIVYRIFIRENNRMQFFNKMLTRILGYKEEELMAGKICCLDPLIVEKDRKKVVAEVTQAVIDNRPFTMEYRIKHKDGSLRYLQEQGTSIRDADGEPLYIDGVILDTTERWRAEEAREKLVKEIQLLLESTDEGIYGIDMNGNCTFINKAAVKALGYEDEPVLGMNMHDLVHHRYPDGTSYPVDKCPIYNAFRIGQGCRVDHEVYWRRDGSSFPAEYSSYPIIDQGVIKGAVVTFTDITERKRLEAQLLHSQKMEAVGTLAGGVAHDFNNLLTTATVNLELAKAKMSKNQPAEPYFEEIETVIQRAAQLTNQLLAFSRRQILKLVPLNLNNTITSLSKMLSRLIGEYIELDLRLAAGLGKVKADPGQIEQVIMNLVINARDAMPTGGKLTLKTQNVYLDESYIKEHTFTQMGDYVALEVADTGCGMDKATVDRIFEPFFTTKEVGKGTGLGLSTVFGIIKQHGGYINVYSEPDQGSIFKIYLPRSEEAAAVEEVKEVPRKIEGGKETILLAEDEGPLREAIKNILEMFGYTVLAAEDGQAAMEVYQREGEGIDLVILDAVMPMMGGVEVAEWIKKINPSQKILFSSGYAPEGVHEKFVIPEKMHFIQKPYTARELARKVREVLEK